MTNIDELEKMVGQLILAGIPDPHLGANTARLFEKVGVGGVILFKHNYENLDQLVQLNNSIQKTLMPQAYRGMPLWIAVDQEGGRVQRFKQPFTVMPPQALWAKINSPKTCYDAGFILGKELRACGVNINFAPVIDVLQVDAKAIGDRSFSSDPNVVANLGSAVVRGLQKSGIMAVAKHFPGHGSVVPDSHEELPVSPKTIEDLEAIDWIPFRKVIRSRVEGIMTAHILFNNIDASRPATLSRKLIQDWLRKDMRYQRLIFSDDLEMGAIQKKYELKEAAFLAIEAGCDQLLLGHEWERVEEVWQHLVKAFYDGVLPMARLEESISRIVDSKKRHLLPFKLTEISDAKLLVGHPSHRAIADAMARGEVPDSLGEGE